jgi:hypothetical protein
VKRWSGPPLPLELTTTLTGMPVLKECIIQRTASAASIGSL